MANLPTHPVNVSANIQIPPNVNGTGQFLPSVPLASNAPQRPVNNNVNDVALSIVRNNPPYKEGDEGYKSSWEFKHQNGKTYRIKVRHEGAYQALKEGDWKRVQECALKIIVGLGGREGIKSANLSLQTGACNFTDHEGKSTNKTIDPTQIDQTNPQLTQYLNVGFEELKTALPEAIVNARIVEITNEGGTTKADTVERLRSGIKLEKSDVEHYLVHLRVKYAASPAQQQPGRKAADLKIIKALKDLEAAPTAVNNQPAPAPTLYDGWIKPYFDRNPTINTDALKKELYFAAVIEGEPLITIGVDFGNKKIVFFDSTGCADNSPGKTRFDTNYSAKLEALKTALDRDFAYQVNNANQPWAVMKQEVPQRTPEQVNHDAVCNLHYIEESLQGLAFQPAHILNANDSWTAIRETMANAIDTPSAPQPANPDPNAPAPTGVQGALGNAWRKVKDVFGKIRDKIRRAPQPPNQT